MMSRDKSTLIIIFNYNMKISGKRFMLLEKKNNFFLQVNIIIRESKVEYENKREEKEKLCIKKY